MPLIKNPYTPPALLINRHLETIYPAVFRRVKLPTPIPIEINTPDGDFLQLEVYNRTEQKDHVVIVSHGLEGNTSKPYVKGMARAFLEDGWDAIAWNYRGCGSKMNKTSILYHSGSSYDLETVVDFAKKRYKYIFLVGFSLGGNITLKYLGEKNRPEILGAFAISTPIDLLSCSMELEKAHNYIYSNRFLRNLKKKIRAKENVFNNNYPFKRLSKIKTIYEFDDLFTAPIHGFVDAKDYYQKCSSLNYLSTLTTPTLLINAENDPFLSAKCFPYELAKDHEFLFFDAPSKGGHVGFSIFNGKNRYWSEKRAVEFANRLLFQ